MATALDLNSASQVSSTLGSIDTQANLGHWLRMSIDEN